jgi:hypothetical protein
LFNDGHVEYAETRSIKQRDNNCVTWSWLSMF